MADLFKDFAYAKLTGPVVNGDIALQVDNTDRFPTNVVLAKGQFYATIESPLETGTFEIVQVLSKTSTTLVVERGVDGTVEGSHPANAYVKQSLTSKVVRRLRAGLLGNFLPVYDLDLHTPGDTFFNETEGQLYLLRGNGTWAPVGVNETLPFQAQGTIAVKVGVSRIYVDAPARIASVRASVFDPPSGQSIIVDVNKNGSTIYGDQAERPTIPVAGQTAVGGLASVTQLAANDYLSVDIDQIGTGFPGSDLLVVIRLNRNA